MSNDKFAALLGAGLVQKFNKKSAGSQRIMKLIVLAVSLLPLIALSLILYFLDDSSKLGIITSISVVLMDLFSFLIYQSNMVDAPIIVVILLIVNRVMMVSLGQNYFIYGYMMLYIMYSTAFVFQIARNKFPYEGDVVSKAAGIKNFLKEAKNSGAEIKVMTQDEKDQYWRQMLSNPELLQLILTILYMAILSVLSVVDIKGVYLMPAVIMTGTDAERELEYWQVGLYTMGLMFSLYFVIGCYRLMQRKA